VLKIGTPTDAFYLRGFRSSLMGIFRDLPDLIQGVIGLTAARLDALERDVDHCLTLPYAPLPAIEYCFSTVDLLGALYKGDASVKANTTSQSSAYMVDVMGYTPDQAKLLQKIFRHKVVHLAMPFAVIKYDSKYIGWKYYHKNRTDHLKLKKLPTTRSYRPTSLLILKFDYQFVLGIKDFEEDIVNSVIGKSGYLNLVKSSKTLQRNFETALTQIYDPTNWR
jgi:hypothetical protein